MKIKRKLLLKIQKMKRKRKEKMQVNHLNSLNLGLNYRIRVRWTRRREILLWMGQKSKGKVILRYYKMRLSLKKIFTDRINIIILMKTTKIIAKLNPKVIVIIGSKKSKNKKNLRFINNSTKILWTQMKSSKN